MSYVKNFLKRLALASFALAACEHGEDTDAFDAGATAVPGGAGSAGGVGGSTAGAAAGNVTGTGGTRPGAAASGGTTGPTGNSGAASGGTAGGGAATSDGGMNGVGGPGGTGGAVISDAAGTAGPTDGGSAVGDGGATGGADNGSCPGLPSVTDYSVTGPFGEAMTQAVDAGSEGCTLFRPGASLGMNGFKHPIAVWGNGITTTPTQYRNLLSLFASHGIVTIACNSTNPERPCLNACMDWLVQQNSSGPMAGKLDTDKEFTIGYSWGGGAAIDTATRPNVKATVSFHGMPPRQSPWAQMKAPLLLFTSTGDTFVSASGYVTPNYNSSRVPTFYATLNESVSHTYVIDRSGGAAKEKGPAIAFLLHFGCGVESAKAMFFGADCTLCKSPWTAQKKPPEFWR